MPYNEFVHTSLTILSIIILILSIFGSLVTRKKSFILKFLPLILIFDIPINQIDHLVKPLFPIRIWFIYVFICMILYYRDFLHIFTRAVKYILLFLFFISMQMLIGMDSTIWRGWVKVIVVYLPLIIVTIIYFNRLKRRDIKFGLYLSLALIISTSLIQILSYSVFNYNIFILNLFHKPSATFSEPVWSGIVSGAIISLLIIFSSARFLKILPLCLIFLGSKSAFIIYYLSKFEFRVKYILLSSVIIIAMIYVSDFIGLIDYDLLIESIVIHSGNWIVAWNVFSQMDLMQKIFGIGWGQSGAFIDSHSILSNINLISLSSDVDKSFDLSFLETSFGGDVSNIFLELLISVGCFGMGLSLVFIYNLYKSMSFLYRQGFKYFIIISMIHPFYYVGFGVFFVTILVLASKNLEKKNEDISSNA